MPKNDLMKGIKVSDLLNLDYDTFMDMDEKTLRQAVSRLSSAANKRLKAFEKAGEIVAPQYRRAQSSGGKFSTKGKDMSSLRAEYKRVKGFMTAKTSTVGQWNKTKSEIISKLGKEDVRISAEQFDDFFKAYADLLELKPDANMEKIKYEVFRQISDALDDTSKSPDEIATDIAKEVDRIYAEQEQLEQARLNGGMSEFFENQ